MALNRASVIDKGKDRGIQRDILPVYDVGSESGNKVLNMDHPMREIWLSNDSSTYNATAVFTGPNSLSLEFLLYPGEVLNERLPEFLTITVTATGAWRWYVRSGLVE
jgi:hypothetical protein